MLSQELLLEDLQKIGLTASQLNKVIDALIAQAERERDTLAESLNEAQS